MRASGGDRGIDRIRQAELDDAGAPPLGEFVGADRGQEAIDDERLDLNPGELHRARRADQLRAKGERPSVRMELQDITAYLRNRAEAPKDRMPKLPVKIRRKEKVL